MDANILIADDQADILQALELLLKPRGVHVESASTPQAVLQAIEQTSFDVVLMDMNYARGTTTAEEGLDLLRRIEEVDRSLPVVVMTAWSNVAVAVESMRGRVRDFVEKPWDNERLLATIEQKVEQGRSLRAQEREQQEAREIQRRLLPKSNPELAGYEIATTWRPARNVGGDYFDTLDLGDGQFGLCIGDVVGKGLPAALLMSNVQAAVHVFASSRTAPAELCRSVNRILCGNMGPNRFITFFYALLDVASGDLRFCNAGQNPPLLARDRGPTVELRTGGGPLGIDASMKYAEGSARLGSGDRLLLFTDGLTEAEDEAGEQFGVERLQHLLTARRNETARSALDAIVAEVLSHGGEALGDDATAVLIARRRSST